MKESRDMTTTKTRPTEDLAVARWAAFVQWTSVGGSVLTGQTPARDGQFSQSWRVARLVNGHGLHPLAALLKQREKVQFPHPPPSINRPVVEATGQHLGAEADRRGCYTRLHYRQGPEKGKSKNDVLLLRRKRQETRACRQWNPTIPLPELRKDVH